MKKLLLVGIIIGLSYLPTSYGMGLEELIEKPLPYWQEGINEFFKQSAEEINRKKLEIIPSNFLKIETFTQITNSYKLPVKETEKLYSRAVKVAIKDVLSHFKCRVQDPDVAFLMEDLTDQVRVNCKSDIKKFIERNSKEYLRETIKECKLLKANPSISSFLNGFQCKELLKHFPDQTLGTLFEYLRKEEREIYEKPERAKGEHLKEIVKNLKNNNLL